VAPDTAGVPADTSKPTDLGQFNKLQAERMAQAARADSIARARTGTPPPPAPAPGAGSVMANGGAAATLAILAYRVPEARVDYVRVFRGGLFGAERIERRATARIALRLFAPGSDAVRWSASADTSLGDVVMKSEIALARGPHAPGDAADRTDIEHQEVHRARAGRHPDRGAGQPLLPESALTR
jgi:hypothetical protein